MPSPMQWRRSTQKMPTLSRRASRSRESPLSDVHYLGLFQIRPTAAPEPVRKVTSPSSPRKETPSYLPDPHILNQFGGGAAFCTGLDLKEVAGTTKAHATAEIHDRVAVVIGNADDMGR